MTLLSFEDVEIWYVGRGTSPTKAVSGISLDVRPGELVAIVGESGSGKSTLIRSAIGLLPRSSRVEGRILLDGNDVAGWSHNKFARYRGSYVGFVPQDPGVSLNAVKQIGKQLEDALSSRTGKNRLLPFSASAQRHTLKSQALKFLELAGLADPGRIYAKYPHELSGGMKQRVLIAIALSGEPELLIADEPTSALDVTVQKQILDHLDRLRTELGIGILLVTHDLGVALDRADRVVVMRGGAVVEEGRSAELLHRAADPYTRRLLDSAPGLHTGGLTPRPIRLGPLAAHTTADRPGIRSSAQYAIDVKGVSKTFHAAHSSTEPVVAAADVSFRVATGTTHSLVGESGAGKSTIARIVAGLRTPDAGEVTLLGNTGSWSRRELSRRLQFVYQNPYSSLNPRLSVADLITEPLRVHLKEIDRTQRRAIAEELLDGVRLDRKYAARRAGELSGGQAQRVAIARALALSPEIVILDEAVSALDVSVQAEILQLLVDLQAAYSLTYLFITHDLGVVRLIADTVTVMRHGTVVESGPTAQILDDPTDEYTRRLVDSVPGSHLFL
ncbi:ABC transporter ATP-binding protein [Rhodococcus zopfii]|uniref:ABC transporter ATP-binding protein n=1 Tax=Rhodococcus zopfii TaxID=43772 RepID=UPI00111134FE|nr:ABC transporter ATP-binding protein [Rhodococcus zopfii]